MLIKVTCLKCGYTAHTHHNPMLKVDTECPQCSAKIDDECVVEPTTKCLKEFRGGD